MEERKNRLEERKKQRKEDRRKAFYLQKEEEEQRIHEEQLKKGNQHLFIHYDAQTRCGRFHFEIYGDIYWRAVSQKEIVHLWNRRVH